jgi:tetratricopeptide (TPR) repeat protein
MSSVAERVRGYNSDGLYLYQRGEYRQAREVFQAALDMAPEENSLRFNLAQAWEKCGDLAKAEKLYQECLQREPNSRECRQALVVLMMHQGRREEAGKLVEEWLTREPERGDAYALDGWLWHQSGDLPRAQARLQQAVQIDPANAWALTELGLVYESLRRPERALALYERSLDQDPDQSALVDRVNRLRAQGVSYPKPD